MGMSPYCLYSESMTLIGFYIADSNRHMVSDMTCYVSIWGRAASNVANAYAIYILESLKLREEDINSIGNALSESLHDNYERQPIISASFAIVKNRVQSTIKTWQGHEVNSVNDENWKIAV